MTDMTTIEILVSRVITDTGRMAVRLRTPEDFSAVEVLGLLEAAKLQIYRDMIGGGL